MTSEDLKTWQKHMGYTYDQACVALGVSRATYARYVQIGASKTIALACAAIASKIEPWAIAQ